MGVRILAGALLRPKGRVRLEYAATVDPDVQAVTLIAKPPSVVTMIESAPDHMTVENRCEKRSAIVVVVLGDGERASRHHSWGLLDLFAAAMNADVTLTGGKP